LKTCFWFLCLWKRLGESAWLWPKWCCFSIAHVLVVFLLLVIPLLETITSSRTRTLTSYDITNLPRHSLRPHQKSYTQCCRLLPQLLCSLLLRPFPFDPTQNPLSFSPFPILTITSLQNLHIRHRTRVVYVRTTVSLLTGFPIFLSFCFHRRGYFNVYHYAD